MTVDETFLSSVAHDLRGQLNTIVTGVHYLLRYEANLGQTGRDMLGRVNGAGQRMRRLLEEFDNAVWIDGGSPSALELEPCHADVLLKSAIDRLNQAIESREATLDLQLPPDLPPFNADAELCGAAIEYALDFALSRSRKKTVHLTAALIEGQTVLSIEDEGGSIPEDAQGRLLDPFVEREMVPKAELGQWRRERLGLGLAIARGILAAHGGGITAESAPAGQGILLRCALHRADGTVASGLHPR
jgi:two-component system OmpR family sensor kinase